LPTSSIASTRTTRIGVLIADEKVAANVSRHAGPNVFGSAQTPSVVGHLHEVATTSCLSVTGCSVTRSIPSLKIAPNCGGQWRRHAPQLMHSAISMRNAGRFHLGLRSREATRSSLVAAPHERSFPNCLVEKIDSVDQNTRTSAPSWRPFDAHREPSATLVHVAVERGDRRADQRRGHTASGCMSRDPTTATRHQPPATRPHDVGDAQNDAG
jgi:hypothetical protein